MLWLVLWVVSLWVLPPIQTAAPPSPVAVRFHHLHYRVADPLSAMKLVARTSTDTPTILQGLGVGVIASQRANGEPEYVLFDRRAPDAPPASVVNLAAAYPAIVSWLHARGIDVAPDAGHVAELAAKVPGESLDHVAFATPNLPEVVASLRRANVRFTEPNDEAVLFQVTTGPTGTAGTTGTVEIVRDPDLPDRFWCPMHPDVRSAAAGACPICRMTLVPIPVPRVGEYRMVVSWLSPSRAGARGLRIAIVYPDGEGPPATSGAMSGAVHWGPSLLPVHDKRLHLFIVSRDLRYFAHTHPEQVTEGSFELVQSLPAGEYMVIADFLPADGTPQLVQRAIITPGFAWPSWLEAVPAPSAAATVDGIRATMDAADVVAGRAATVRVTLTDARSGAPIADLEPYLSAPAHGLFVSADLTQAAHAHPREQDLFGSTFSFDFLPASPGVHKFWVQVQRHGQVVTFPFVLVVG